MVLWWFHQPGGRREREIEGEETSLCFVSVFLGVCILVLVLSLSPDSWSPAPQFRTNHSAVCCDD